jgi:hypothetical protein
MMIMICSDGVSDRMLFMMMRIINDDDDDDNDIRS